MNSEFHKAHIWNWNDPSQAAEARELMWRYWNQGENKMDKIDKQASIDAQRWAAAEMFYGEGAGTRRRHLNAELQTKLEDDRYFNAFNKAYASLDMNKFAEQAIKERKKLDRAAKASRNFRAVKSGNLNNLSTGVFVVVGTAIVLHQTGYDKKIEAEAKKLYKKAKVEVKYRKARWQRRNVERI